MPDTRTQLTALIAEDEPLLGEELREGLQELWPELHVEAVATDGVAALRDFERISPSIAFLDIHMPRIDGLDVARRIASRAHVVFITAYDHHALAAFDAGAVDYVLKPLQLARLATTVQRLKERIGQPPADLRPTLRAVTEVASAPRRHLQWITASRASGIRMIMVDDICYFKADSKYTLVIEEDAESVIRKTIKDLVDELDPGRFWQVHRSTLVNVSTIETVVRDENGDMFLTLKNRPERLAVSTPYRLLFRQM